MSARLTVLLGAGGVGKTTLAAGYAIALARAGRRVALLGIDPSRRLQGALGVPLEDHASDVAGEPRLSAAILLPHASLRRWAGEALRDDGARARLFANPFFVALADRLAAATDVIAAVRVAEWAERDPSLEDLVVDTAPGVNAIEFLRRPRALAALLEGRLVTWLRHVPRALAHVGGAALLRDFAEFLALVETPIARLLERLALARRWLEASGTRVVLVTSVSEDAAKTARGVADALVEIGLPATAAVINRALPEALGRELERIGDAELAEAVALLRYARAYGAMQGRVVAAVAHLAPSCALLPATCGLDEATRLDVLATLGERLRLALEAQAR